MRRLVLAIVALAGATSASSAHAATYCVNLPSCPSGGIVKATVTDALTAANAADDADEVRVGAGSYSGGPFEVKANTSLGGAGSDKTTLDGTMTTRDAVVTGLKLVLPANPGLGVDSYGSTFLGINIDGSQVTNDSAGGLGGQISPTTFSDSTITMAHGTGVSAGSIKLHGVRITAPKGIVESDYRLTVENTVVRANVGLNVQFSPFEVAVSNTAFVGTGTNPTGLIARGYPTTLTHVTFSGPSTGIAIDKEATALDFPLTLNSVAFKGWATQIKRAGTASDAATVVADYTAVNPAKITQTGTGTLTSTHQLDTTDPKLDASTLVPLADSPVIDAGDPADPSMFDLYDSLRTDGNADGDIVADIGAAEYIPAPPPVDTPTPTPTPTATPTPVPTTTPVPDAPGSTYCVSYAACPAGGLTRPTFDAAVASAKSSGGACTILVGPGTFSSSAPFFPVNLTVKGSGRDATTIVGSITSIFGTLSDFTIKLPATAASGLTGIGGTATRVDIDGSAATLPNAEGFAAQIDPIQLTDSKITMAIGTGVGGGTLRLDDVDITAPTGIWMGDYTGRLHNVRIHANVGINVRGGEITGDNVYIVGTGTNPTGIGAAATFYAPAMPKVTLNHATISSPSGVGTAVDVRGAHNDHGIVVLTNSVFCGWATQINRLGTVDGEGDNPAVVTLDYTAIDPAKIVQGGPGSFTSTHQVNSTDTLLDEATGAPLVGSPVIDAGDPAEAASTDLYGTARPVDGDGNGSKVADIGAVEYVPAPAQPTPTATASPTATATATPTATRKAPQAVLLRVKKIARGVFKARARVVLDHGLADCAGGTAVFRAGHGNVLRTTFDGLCHADITLNVGPRKRGQVNHLYVRFGGTAALRPMSSSTLRF
ncbi:MAG: hypothetical protein QOF76_714 [Solirubrobacteraceae bacterium]|nr:hypothetical protein [Solirubrobacteraceae bacterium]